MKKYYFSWYNSVKKIQMDNDYVIAENEIEAKKSAVKLIKALYHSGFNEKNILYISETPINNIKKYYFIWHNIANNQFHLNFVSAKDEEEAKEIAVLLMRVYSNEKYYTVENIQTIQEITDNIYYTKEKIEKMQNEIENFVDKIINEVGV